MLFWQGSAPTQAQAPADSVVLIRLPDHGESYVFPRRAAVHYRNLVRELVPALEARVAELESARAAQAGLAENRLDQIGLLEQRHAVMAQQVASLESDLLALRQQFERVDAARLRERRWKNFWKRSSLVFVGATIALGAVALLD
jgi:hypothetical protein